MAFEFNNCRVGQGYWKDESNRVNALKWLFEERLQWSLDDIREKFTLNVMNNNGLATLRTYYTSLFAVVNAVYPNKIQPWELQQAEVWDGTWNDKNNRIKAIRWLIDKLRSTEDNNVLEFNESIFSRYGLTWLLERHYSGNLKRALNEAFPKGQLYQ